YFFVVCFFFKIKTQKVFYFKERGIPRQGVCFQFFFLPGGFGGGVPGVFYFFGFFGGGGGAVSRYAFTRPVAGGVWGLGGGNKT
ncbi:hypothetical protein, partial [Enterobacter intestinihominis]